MNPNSQTTHDVLARWHDRIMAIRSGEDGLAILTGLAAEQARAGADLVFLKVASEDGWTLESGKRLADAWVHGHLDSIVATMLAFGGTSEMTEAMIDAAIDAFGDRLHELAKAHAPGGSA